MVGPVKYYFTPMSILDIGANIGEFYGQSVGYFPDAYYYLIEPNPECEEALQSLGVDYYLGAVSDVEKEATLFISTLQFRCTGNSFYREKTYFFAEDKIKQHTLTTTTLDILFQNKVFDLIKIDTQGSELDILKGGKNLIQQAKGAILELARVEYNTGAPQGSEVTSYMEELGFIKRERLGTNFNPETRELVHEDYLFIRKDFIVE